MLGRSRSAAAVTRSLVCGVEQDMEVALAAQKDRWGESFVVRRWVDIDVDMEFRHVTEALACAT